MSLRPRPEVENLKPCTHGSIDYAELQDMGIAPEAVLDFSVNTNPFMPPQEIRKALDSIPIGRYPDSGSTELRQLLAERLGVTPDNILVGSGTMELIRLIALTYFGKGEPVLILEPTFGEYEIACRIAGAKPIKQWTRAEDNFTLKIADTIGLIKEHNPKGVFICNPNNPTGRYLSRQEIETVLESLNDGILILDEAYIAFVEQTWSSMDLISRGNVVILRSMTKDYALAGLRLGYAVADNDIIGNLRRTCPPWNVNVIAQKMGVGSLENMDYLEQSKLKIREAKQFLTDNLSRLDFHILPSDTNFFLMKVGNAQVFRAALLKHGILVRDCASFGLPEYVRIAPRTMPECRRLITTIQDLKHEGEL